MKKLANALISPILWVIDLLLRYTFHMLCSVGFSAHTLNIFGTTFTEPKNNGR